jgi:uncharacterized membrane protein
MRLLGNQEALDMNKFLAEAAAVLNGFIALITIVAFAVWGTFLGSAYLASDVTGLIVGLIVGFIVAVMVNGVLAIFIQMYRELKAIRQQLIDTKLLQAPTSQARVVPRMPALAVGGLGK